MYFIKQENDTDKFNYYAEKIFNKEYGHSLDFSSKSFVEDHFLIYSDDKIAGGFRIVYGDNGLPIQDLDIDIKDTLNILTTIEPGRLFILKEYRKLSLYKFAIQFVDYFVSQKETYNTLVADSILRVEKLYAEYGYKRLSAPFFDPSVSRDLCDPFGNNSVLLYKNIPRNIKNSALFTVLEMKPIKVGFSV